MSPNSGNNRSNPIKRAFSRFLERGDVSKPKDAARATSTARTERTPVTPQPQAASRDPAPGTGARVTGAAAKPASRSAAPGNAAAVRTPAASGAALDVAGAGTSASRSGPVARTRRTYTVQKGDSLSKIAHDVYGRADRWHAIFDANRDRIDDPDLIHPGQVLVLPDAPTLH